MPPGAASESTGITLRNTVIASILIYLMASGLAVRSTYQAVLQRDLQRLTKAGQIRVDQAAERLINQLDTYRVLTNLLARDPRVAAALRDGADAGAAEFLLRDRVLTFGAERIEVLNRAGKVVAASGEPAGAISRRGSPLVTAALNGRLGTARVLEAGQRQFRFSRGILDGGRRPAGIVIVSVNIATLEFEWAVIPEAIGFFDDRGVVVASNRPSLLLRQDRADAGPETQFAAFPQSRRLNHVGFAVRHFSGTSDLPREAVVIARDVPRIGVTARGFLDTGPAHDAARLSAWLAAAVATGLGLAALAFVLWRRRLSDRLAIEAAANARLEARVASRTAELHATQNQLVQATKMTALGQMSAGISHELNQPLAAIVNFAENGERFLARDRAAEARQNFARIAQQVGRIDRIVKNLRGFARNEPETPEPVDFTQAVRAALTLVEPALRKSRTALALALPDGPVTVMGGQVRLQQVIVNILTNALDAMADTDAPELRLNLTVAGAEARLTVRDTGPGIADPVRVFEPFYTTKEMGASKGLGLGLSISYGIIGSFGGELRARNHPDGGAEFTIAMPLADEGRMP